MAEMRSKRPSTRKDKIAWAKAVKASLTKEYKDEIPPKILTEDEIIAAMIVLETLRDTKYASVGSFKRIRTVHTIFDTKKYNTLTDALLILSATEEIPAPPQSSHRKIQLGVALPAAPMVKPSAPTRDVS
jgi:hypothetical protein